MRHFQNLRGARKAAIVLATVFGSGTLLSDGCFDSAIAQRFRDASAAGLTAGFSNAITDPTNAEAGLRDAAAALVTGIGAVFQTRDGNTSSGT